MNDRNNFKEAVNHNVSLKKKTNDNSLDSGETKHPSSKKLLLLSFAFSLFSLAIVGYVGLENLQITEQLQQLQIREATFPEKITSINSRISQVTQNVRSLDDRSFNFSEQSSLLTTKMQKIIERVNQLTANDRSIWLISEAEYLMRLANQRVQMSSDIQSAIVLLEQSKDLLIKADEYGLFKTRTALTKDITRLKAVQPIDVESLWLDLNVLSEKIYQLPILPTYKKPDESIVAANENTDQLSWKDKVLRSISQAWQSFLSQFQVSSDRTNFNPELLPPQEEQYLRHQLHLTIEQAQIALLQRHQKIYTQSLNNIELWLNRWFLNKTVQANHIIEQIDILKKQTIFIDPPDISGSLKALQLYMKNAKIRDLFDDNLKKTTTQIKKNKLNKRSEIILNGDKNV